ncbi:MAG: hypothetical protein J7L32_05535 [Thermoplasmata archaeon]|nr:hypothetical protein [Thermoplasmata archaeon]
MPRYRWLKKRLKEISESTSVEKTLLILPFFILFLDLYLLTHAVYIRDIYVIIPALILFIFSLAEIIVAFDEMHERTVENILDRRLASKVRSIIRESNEKLTVKNVMRNSLEKYPELEKHKKRLYHLVCQILPEYKSKKD